jgi:hypothetical protein
MRLITFERAGKRSHGAVVGEGIVDLSDRAADLRALLSSGALEGLQEPF